MTAVQSIVQTFKRYRTLQTDRISALPVVILMPHSACNCRCVMCDIWKDNKNLKQLTEADVEQLLVSLKKMGTRQVLMSGGEALLHPGFFRFCEILQQHQISVTLLSTGLSLSQHADNIVRYVSSVIVSMDGDEATHNAIRNIPNAFQKLHDGVRSLKERAPHFPVTARTVIHRLNYMKWPAIIEAAKKMGVDQISFLPADVSSHAFNREILWSEQRQDEILPALEELDAFTLVLENIIALYKTSADNHFIAESAEKLRKIDMYYRAIHGLSPFPYKRCNAPWVSSVVEADGTVRPCFFHAPMGNIHTHSLAEILNDEKNIQFRKNLDTDSDPTCMKCVCSLYLSPAAAIH